MEYNCSICKKNYKSYKSLWKHNSTFHKNNLHTNTTIHTTETHIKVENKCINCDAHFSRKDSLKRHMDANKCNKKDNKIDLIIKENLEMKKEMEHLKSMLQSALKIHPKTLNKINNQLNVSGNMNNTFNIVQLGRENLSDILSSKEKMNILNRQAMSLNDLVELIHISGKYKSFQNVYITNLQNSVGYRYDEKQNNFIAVPKSELLADIVDSRMYDIEKFFEEFQQKLEPKKVEQIKKFIERMSNEEDGIKGIKKEEIKLVLYNNKQTIISDKNDNILLIDKEIDI
jgi:hypothetical protein